MNFEALGHKAIPISAEPVALASEVLPFTVDCDSEIKVLAHDAHSRYVSFTVVNGVTNPNFKRNRGPLSESTLVQSSYVGLGMCLPSTYLYTLLVRM